MNILIKYVILLLVLGLSAISVSAGEHVLIPKFGVVDIEDNTTHLVDTNIFDFNDDIRLCEIDFESDGSALFVGISIHI